MDTATQEILDENNRRSSLTAHHSPLTTGFNPITGFGSTGHRQLVEIPSFPIPRQRLPLPMLKESLVRLLIKHKGIDGFISDYLHEVPDDELRDRILDAFLRLRSRPHLRDRPVQGFGQNTPRRPYTLRHLGRALPALHDDSL